MNSKLPSFVLCILQIYQSSKEFTVLVDIEFYFIGIRSIDNRLLKSYGSWSRHNKQQSISLK